MAKSFDALARRTTTAKLRAQAKRRAGALLGEYLLSKIRAGRGLTQVEVARALGITQPSLSKLEKQSDMQLSTLEKIVKALGGELEVIARFPKGHVRISPFSTKSRRSRKTRDAAELPTLK